jgi:ribosome biogenesis GTPase
VTASAAATDSALRARVVATFGRSSLVQAADDPQAAVLPATRRGRKGDVVVGDLVQCSCALDQATIEAIEPRRALLFRADQFRTKALAANIDQVAIVFAPQPPFNPFFIWRALLAAEAAGIASLLVLNKTDLDEGIELAREALVIGASLGVSTLAISARTRPDEARAALQDTLGGRATLLVGQSGMGKSSLLNLMVDANARTQEYSRRLNVGKQTTTASRWFNLPGALGDRYARLHRFRTRAAFARAMCCCHARLRAAPWRMPIRQLPAPQRARLCRHGRRRAGNSAAGAARVLSCARR